MKLSEQMTNQLCVQGLNKPLKIPSSTLSKWRDKAAQLEAGVKALTEDRDTIAEWLSQRHDDIKQLKTENDKFEAALTLIGDVAFDSDGYAGNAEKLGDLVGEIYGYARNPQTAVDVLKEGG